MENLKSTTFNYTADISAGTELIFFVSDSLGNDAWSSNVSIHRLLQTTSCLIRNFRWLLGLVQITLASLVFHLSKSQGLLLLPPLLLLLPLQLSKSFWSQTMQGLTFRTLAPPKLLPVPVLPLQAASVVPSMPGQALVAPPRFARPARLCSRWLHWPLSSQWHSNNTLPSWHGSTIIACCENNHRCWILDLFTYSFLWCSWRHRQREQLLIFNRSLWRFFLFHLPGWWFGVLRFSRPELDNLHPHSTVTSIMLKFWPFCCICYYFYDCTCAYQNLFTFYHGERMMMGGLNVALRMIESRRVSLTCHCWNFFFSIFPP